MICESCRFGATFNVKEDYKAAAKFHKKCKGDCGCQHKTGPGWFVKRGVKVPPMQTQSP